jgi:hypothetical protein
MRLIQSSSLNCPDGLKFKDFPVSQLPPYAILSHTWGSDEVVWEDFQRGIATQKEAFAKVRYSCLQAVSDGLEWVWIDSACIDKSSSAELSESINSMYDWYQRAETCYTHLEGVAATADVTQTAGEFAGCKWFTRGWTLQELLASREITFFSENWVKLGYKAALSRPLSVITGIDEDILTGARALESASIAKRMSWAAYRKTTRPEDVAYCLIGIFGVNMPMLYGEGQKAFLRLQEEIMKLSDDQSLFAWANLDASPESYHGLLAKSPLDFAYSKSVLPYQDWEFRPPFQVTNRGLRIDLPLTPHEEEPGTIFIAALDCPVPPDYEDSSFLAIYLKKLSHGDQQYTRIRAGQFAKVRERGKRQTVFVKQNTSAIADTSKIFPQHIFQLRIGPSTSEYKVIEMIASVKRQGSQPKVILSSIANVRDWVPKPVAAAFVGPKASGQLACAVMFERVEDGERVLILLGAANGLRVGYNAIELPPKVMSENNWENEMDYSFEALQKMFRPSEPVKLNYNQVTINVDDTVIEASKYYLIDIHLERTDTPDRFGGVIVGTAKLAYDRAVGREVRPDFCRAERAEKQCFDTAVDDNSIGGPDLGQTKGEPKKLSSTWKRLISR